MTVDQLPAAYGPLIVFAVVLLLAWMFINTPRPPRPKGT